MNDERLLAMIAELKTQLKSTLDENATLRYQRDLARAQVRSLLPVATPQEEAEYQRLKGTAVKDGLKQLIQELEADGGK